MACVVTLMLLHVQACAICYGVTAGLRGYLFSLINADLIQVCLSCMPLPAEWHAVNVWLSRGSAALALGRPFSEAWLSRHILHAM